MAFGRSFWTFAPAVLVTAFLVATSLWTPDSVSVDASLLAEQVAIFVVLAAAVIWARQFNQAGWRPRLGLTWLWLAGPLWLAVLTPLGLAFPNIAADPGRAALWIGASLFVGLNEETIFRGFLLTGLRRWFGPLSAALISSVAFGLLHSLNALSGADPVFLVGQMVVACGTGLALAAVTLRAGSIWPAMFLHFAGDAVGLSALGGFENAIQTSAAAPSMIIFGAIVGGWGVLWIWLMARRGRLAEVETEVAAEPGA